MFVSVAHAMGNAGAAGAQDPFMQFLPLLIMLAIFYFLLIRPQQKKAKEHKNMLNALKKDDVVLTTGGLVGRIKELKGDVLVLDLGSNVVVNLRRDYVVDLAAPEEKVGKPEKSRKADKSEKAAVADVKEPAQPETEETKK
ncbi:MAG: preprotein translocase subunit YajC [Desulfovibrionaceae bacterium]|nr:preprotein translocase subunit YajC [Desulfovibrionaceae bacterium]